MKAKKKLDVLNKMEFTDFDSDGEQCLSVWVDNTESNKSLLRLLGATDGDLEDAFSDDGKSIDVSGVAWNYTSANYFDGVNFTE